MLGDVKLPYNNSKRNTTGMGHNCLHVRFFLLDLDSDLDLPSLKRTWTRTWTCSLKVDLDLDLDFTVAGLVTSLACATLKEKERNNSAWAIPPWVGKMSIKQKMVE